MSRIVLIETSTALCSTALVEDGKVVSSRRSDSPRAHASLTAPFVKQMLEERGVGLADCDAVCVSSGPGSYTGLRVGSSTAKGLCFGASKPLLAVCTLDVLAAQAQGRLPEGCRCIIPVIDARRLEVYCAEYSADGSRLTEVAPVVLEAGSFAERLAEGPVLFIGDGADKTAAFLREACAGTPVADNIFAIQECPCAEAMAEPATKAFDEGRFENTAYFEPFYLKQFVATVSKKSVFQL